MTQTLKDAPMTQYAVGQTVLLFEDRRDPIEVSVTRVGRTNVYITRYGRERGFRMSDGVQVGNYVGKPDRILTFEQEAERERRRVVRLALDAHGIRPGGLGDYKQSTDTLEKLLAVLDSAESA